MNDNKAYAQKLEQLRKDIPAVIAKAPAIAKTEGLKFIASNFNKQGFEEKPGKVNGWKSKEAEGARKPTLVGEKRGGSLRRSWSGKNTKKQVEFTNPNIYAGVHNEGLRAGRPPGFTMPERRMIGPSVALGESIQKKVNELAKKTLE